MAQGRLHIALPPNGYVAINSGRRIPDLAYSRLFQLRSEGGLDYWKASGQTTTMTGTVLYPNCLNALTDSPPSIRTDDQKQHFAIILAGTMHAISKTSDCCLLIVHSEAPNLQSEDHPIISSLLEMAATLAVQLHLTSLQMAGSHELQSCIDYIRDLTKDSPHPKLLIAGSNLETAITFVALEALAHGFDVYLLMDFIEQPDKELSQFHVQRLQQAGTVSTTLIQLLGEWSITSESEELTDRIAEISTKLLKSRLRRS